MRVKVASHSLHLLAVLLGAWLLVSPSEAAYLSPAELTRVVSDMDEAVSCVSALGGSAWVMYLLSSALMLSRR